MATLTAAAPDPKAVLCKAVLNAQERLGLTQDGLGRVLGLDRSSVARMKKRGQLDPEGKVGELALMLIRVYRALFALVGESEQAQKHWMHTENRHLGGIPAQLITRVEGLSRVLQYLDAMRGRV